MIFATVGSQMPFDRLIRALDTWAAHQANGREVLAQIGSATYQPSNLRTVPSLSPTGFREAVRAADLIVAHAGMGSVLTAMEFGKPLVVLPRLGTLQETRNDHQVATAKWLASKPGIYVAMLEAELDEAIRQAQAEAATTGQLSSYAPAEFTESLKRFIHA